MNTLFDKIWDAHVVTTVEDGPTQLYIDRLYCHEVTSPQAFAGLRERGIKVLRPEKVFCMPDHNTPTHDQDKPIEDPISKTQVDVQAENRKAECCVLFPGGRTDAAGEIKECAYDQSENRSGVSVPDSPSDR